ncbi:hypothetical protein C6495_13100 [Candidatus Poribacteria bacterium]|nr:MAG: hypothetical protein C6495_13100 [Candidatus Poribacteria bacterium]
MKGIVCLLIAMFFVSPAFGELTEERVTQIFTTALVPVIQELASVKEELALVKEELALAKNEITGLKGEVRGHKERLSFQGGLLIALIAAVITADVAIVIFVSRESGKTREMLFLMQEKMAAQQTELAELRAENRHLKASSPLVSPSGGRLEVDNAGGG